MKIVILDGRTLNPGDLSWDGLAELGELTIYERTPPELVLKRCAGAEAIITNKSLVNREVLSALPQVRYIGVTAKTPLLKQSLLTFCALPTVSRNMPTQ